MTTFRIATAAGHADVEGEIVGQYGVHGVSARWGGAPEPWTAYFVTHLPTGCRLARDGGFAGFADRATALRIAALWSEHAPRWMADAKLGTTIVAPDAVLAFHDAIVERVAMENHRGREKCGAFAPPAM